MKTISKKLASIVLALCLCFSLVGTALAAGTASTDTGTVTISGLEPGVTVTAYQIAEADYDGDGNFLGYKMTVDGGDFTIATDGSYDEGTLTEANLAALYENVGNAVGTATANETGTATFTLPVGSYLFVVTGSEATVYSMVIGSVYYDTAYDEDSDSYVWNIENGAVNVQGDNLWVKAATPTVTKTEHHTGGDDTHGESTSVGDEIWFDITISSIPSYEGDNPVFDVDDVLTNLTISDAELSSLTVKIMNGEETVATLTKDTDYTVTPGDAISDGIYNEFDVNFVIYDEDTDTYTYTLNAYANKGYTILIEYQATVVDDENYVEGEDEHDNDVTLTYATTSYVANNTATDTDKDYEYDFEIVFTKIDGTTDENLAGATFGLYEDSECETPYMRDGEEYTATSDENGVVEFTGLDTGTYYVKEIEAPAGYILNQNVYTVTIQVNSYNDDGSIGEYTITISGTGYDSTNKTIANTPVNSNPGLPSTGGMGTTIFYIIGGVLVAGAVVVLITRRRMNHEA